MQWCDVTKAGSFVGQGTQDELCNILRVPSDSPGLRAHSRKASQIGPVGASLLDDWLGNPGGNVKKLREDESRLNE